MGDGKSSELRINGNRLWASLMEMAKIGATPKGGVCRLTLTHEMIGAPATATMVAGSPLDEAGGGGWAWVLSDLKSLLETGSPLSAA